MPNKKVAYIIFFFLSVFVNWNHAHIICNKVLSIGRNVKGNWILQVNRNIDRFMCSSLIVFLLLSGFRKILPCWSRLFWSQRCLRHTPKPWWCAAKFLPCRDTQVSMFGNKMVIGVSARVRVDHRLCMNFQSKIRSTCWPYVDGTQTPGIS